MIRRLRHGHKKNQARLGFSIIEEVWTAPNVLVKPASQGFEIKKT
jgi:hypothetical protein